jgi:uncharacterized membrane protein
MPVGRHKETHMKEFLLHLVAQVAVAAAGAAVATLSGADYSSLGPWSGVVQGGVALGVAFYNNFFSTRAKVA